MTDTAARVFYANGSDRPVKNLGWLLAHARESAVLVIERNGRNGNQATLTVYGQGTRGWVYRTPFASYEVCRQFTRKRAFFNARVFDYFDRYNSEPMWMRPPYLHLDDVLDTYAYEQVAREEATTERVRQAHREMRHIDECRIVGCEATIDVEHA